MRQLFSVFLFSFASLFFSQCKIGKISFEPGDVLMFFKVEGQNKKNKIQKIDKIGLEADERPENKIQKVYEMNVLKEPRPENVVQFTSKLTILKQEKPENIVESIDEIVIKADERAKNEIQKIAEIELKAKEKEQNIIQKIQEISIPAKQRQENVIGRKESIELLGIERPQMEPEIIDKIYLHDVKSENKIEGKDNFLIKGNNNEDVSDVNLNVNLEKLKSNDTTTPRHNRDLSDVSGSSLYSEVSTTASKNNSCINDGHNVDKKGVFISAKNSSFAKRNLISSFKSEQEAEDDSDDEKELFIHNNKWQQKRKKNKYFDLINNKIKENERRLNYTMKDNGSSIFVSRYAPIENNKISQEGGNNICKEVKNEDKKDDKNVNISEKEKYCGSNIFKLLNFKKNNGETDKKNSKSENLKQYIHILQKNDIGQLDGKNPCNNAKNLRQKRQIEGNNDKYTGISSANINSKNSAVSVQGSFF